MLLNIEIEFQICPLIPIWESGYIKGFYTEGTYPKAITYARVENDLGELLSIPIFRLRSVESPEDKPSRDWPITVIFSIPDLPNLEGWVQGLASVQMDDKMENMVVIECENGKWISLLHEKLKPAPISKK